MIAPILEEIAANNEGITIVKLNVDRVLRTTVPFKLRNG